jgi:phosphatidylserine/phosphatidylglycerophosphate/cardiolipin synthase-like enzyme
MSCNPAPTDAQLDSTRGGDLQVYFNDPGTRAQNMWEPDAVQIMIDLIDQSGATLDLAVMGFNRQELVDAVLRAHDRGVIVRMVGDADHLYNSGYTQLMDRHIPVVVGNGPHIMHDKFMIVDERFVQAGTSNWTDTDLRHNSNNFVVIDSPEVADDFQAEFDQMFAGRFGHLKEEYFNGRSYQVGDTEIEVWFSPNEDAMGRILEYVDAAEESIRFTIFAFTKDQVGSSYVRKQAEFDAKDLAEGISLDANFRDRRSVAGMIDQSQLHSNGQYHEVYRLLGAGIDMRMDGNDNGLHPGDYQAGGGRLHSKTMVIDAYGADPIVLTGSFNWSASATVSNDEVLLVLKGERIARLYDEYFESLWIDGSVMGDERIGENDLEPGDILLNEVMWYGVNSNDADGFDEFIELRNLTDRDIRLDMWQIAKRDDFVVGIPPGSLLPANGLFTILDHKVESYVDGAPQDEVSAFSGGDLIVNAFNDNRQSRLYLVDGALELSLLDPDANVMDQAGDGGPAFHGGPIDNQSVSMERRLDPGDGTSPDDWYACTLDEGGMMVNEAYQAEVVATPGETNSPE